MRHALVAAMEASISLLRAIVKARRAFEAVVEAAIEASISALRACTNAASIVWQSPESGPPHFFASTPGAGITLAAAMSPRAKGVRNMVKCPLEPGLRTFHLILFKLPWISGTYCFPFFPDNHADS
jgi:hypothetical protein